MLSPLNTVAVDKVKIFNINYPKSIMSNYSKEKKEFSALGWMIE